MRKAKVFRDWGAEVRGNKIILYHGTNNSKFDPENLYYGTFLSAVENGCDVTGNEGASGYGKYVFRLELPVKDIRVNSTGEFQYIGDAKSLFDKRNKYSARVYKAYNNYFGSNFPPREIDRQNDVEATLKRCGDRKALKDFHTRIQKSS